ncbi:exodeoxyribonuclease VII large subunit [uncultured Anaerococcus sp.]|uniref:exodeoxyribonuclease VII large subunit n=1 Tax=uncultured Anaerococcus sp. TaxID=293428 RepID=UPI00288994CC|nr:exodeoxyribonuclease VII large subunit [uncultured Anaerococcus sp.]
MRKPLSVKQFNEYVKSNIKHDPIFQRINLIGELCNVRFNNYHLYFSLKEGTDIIDAVIYYYEGKDISFDFSPGKEVIIRGNLSFNNYSSRLIIVASDIEDVGLSKEFKEFLKMQEEFKAKGYFDIENKNPIPKLVKKVGLITSKDGAAIVDFLAMINSRANDIHIYLDPVKVQGDQAEDLVAKAINRLDKLGLDVIVITRGGGSNEDLASFNQRKIIEAVHEAKTPIISAIGHNIDTTLIDYTSDLSLQTPTEAGSYLIADYIDYEKFLKEKFVRARSKIQSTLDMRSLSLKILESKLENSSPRKLIDDRLKDLRSVNKNLDMAMKSLLTYNGTKLNNLTHKFDYLTKLIDMRKNQIEINFDGTNIYSAHSFKIGDEFDLVFSDGKLKARIIDG